MSFALAVRVIAASPACIFPGTIASCVPQNPILQGAIYALLGGLLVSVGSVIFQSRRKALLRVSGLARPRRARIATILAVAGLALFLTSALIAVVPSPQRIYRLADQDLRVVRETNESVWRSATIQGYSGEVIRGTAVLAWYENQSGRFVGTDGTTTWIAPDLQAFSFGVASPLEGFLIPRDGTYTAYIVGDACSNPDVYPCSGGYTSVASMNLTATNPSLIPTLQFTSAATAAGTYVGSILITAGARTERRGSP